MRARQDTLLIYVIGVDVVVFISPRIAFFADNENSSIYIICYILISIFTLRIVEILLRYLIPEVSLEYILGNITLILRL